jgi:hypothetical protein
LAAEVAWSLLPLVDDATGGAEIWMSFAIISAGILKPLVGHLRGEQKEI